MARSVFPLPSQRPAEKREQGAGRRERQIVRVLALLRALSQEQALSVRDLAVKFCTRRETIYRDLRVLQDAGYPVTGDDGGRLSHPRLLPGNTPEIRFSQAELDALHAAAVQVQVALPSSAALIAAAMKVKALASSEQKLRCTPGGDVIESWASGAKDYRAHELQTAVVVEGILRRRRCHVEYRKPSSTHPKHYDFDPYRLLLVGGGLYVVGKVPKHEGTATLAVDRLISVTLTSTEFAVDATFDPKRCRDQAFGVSWQDPEHIILRFRCDQAPYVRERIWHPTQKLITRPDGDLEMSFHAGGPFEIRRWILGWGDAVEVISPESLRKELQCIAASTALLYSNSKESH